MPKKKNENKNQNNNQNSNQNNLNTNQNNSKNIADEMKILEEIKSIDNSDWVIFDNESELQENADEKDKKNVAGDSVKPDAKNNSKSKNDAAKNQNGKSEVNTQATKNTVKNQANVQPSKNTTVKTDNVTAPVKQAEPPAPEFLGYHNTNLPKWIMMTGNVTILDKFVKFHDKELSAAEKSFLNKKILL